MKWKTPNASQRQDKEQKLLYRVAELGRAKDDHLY
jgi:hypothetical protein